MNKILLALTIIVLANKPLIAQTNYSDAVGIRAGYAFAPTYKKFFNDKLAIEGVAFFESKGLNLQVIGQIHNDLNLTDGLQWYYGAGGSVNFFNKSNYNGVVGIGIVGAIGLDYTIKNVPINLSIDYLPSFSFTSNIGFVGNSWGGVAIRYILK